MFPVPQLAARLEQEWALELAKYFQCPVEQFRANPPAAMNYPAGTLRVELMDGSFVEFRYAFHILSTEKKTIAVFTEHCGHHMYPCQEARVVRDGMVLHGPEHA